MAIYKSKTATKDGRQYFFRIKYKDIMGEVHDYTSRKYKTLKEATQEEALYRIKVQNQEICTSNITLEQVFNEYYLKIKNELKKQSVHKNTILFKHLKILHKTKINDIDLKHYNALYNEINSKKFKAEYKNKIIGLFKALILYSNKYHNTSTSIIKYIERFKEQNQKREMQFFTYEEYLKFSSVIENKDWNLFFKMLYFLGLRQGELQALNWNDIDFERKELKINKTLTTKIKGENWTITTPKTKNSNRIIPIPQNIMIELKKHLEYVKKYSDFKKEWFIFGNSIPYKETTICSYKNKYCDLANLPKIRIHDFRHSCASLLINQGASIALVSKYLGHSKVSITLDIYTHMYKSELEDITNKLNNL